MCGLLGIMLSVKTFMGFRFLLRDKMPEALFPLGKNVPLAIGRRGVHGKGGERQMIQLASIPSEKSGGVPERSHPHMEGSKRIAFNLILKRGLKPIRRGAGRQPGQ